MSVFRRVWWCLPMLVMLGACTYVSPTPDITGQDIRLTVLHISDIHARILPYDMVPNTTDQNLGLLKDRGPYGGIARMAHIIRRERAKAGRNILVDSGDCFQGAPIFNVFHGEVEMRAMSLLKPTAVVVGNHEFDQGASNYAKQMETWASFESIAANYVFEDFEEDWANTLGNMVHPYVHTNIDGLRVAIIGMGNLSSLNSITEAGNSLGIIPLDTVQTARDYVNLLRPYADLVMIVSHLGLEDDTLIAKQVEGVDVIMGGHLHVALKPPLEVVGPTGKKVLMVHSGAFAKYVGRLDLVIRDGEILSHQYDLFPVDRDVPDDPEMLDMLDPYVTELAVNYDFDRVVGTATEDIQRFGDGGGDSALGNFVAESMQYRNRVETDFAVVNTLGIRTDVYAGDITVEALYNVLPFDNTITTMILSGPEVQDVFNYIARRSADRGCQAQAQISGARFVMNCTTGMAEDISIGGSWMPCETTDECRSMGDDRAGEECIQFRCTLPLNPNGVYEMATSDYLAEGGSGFEMLAQNTTQFDTGIDIRSAVIDYLERHPVIPDDDSHIAVSDGRITAVH